MSGSIDERPPGSSEERAGWDRLDVLFAVMNLSGVVAICWAVYAFFWEATWTPFWVTASTWAACQIGLYCPIWYQRIIRFKLSRQLKRREAEIAVLQEAVRKQRQERIQLEILFSQRQAEIASKEAYLSALRAENLEMERLLLQRKVEQEAREVRQRLEIACAAIEADRLEAAAWRMEFTAKQLEVKLNQAELFESLSAIEDNAQDRIIAAYEQGFDHGQRGIVVPNKHLRHLRVVEESA